MKLLFILLAAQTSAVVFTDNYQEIWNLKTILSLSGLVGFSGTLISLMLNYKN